MKTKFLCCAAILCCFSLLTGCNSQEKKQEKTDIKSDSSTANRTDTTSPADQRQPNHEVPNGDNIYVVSLSPEFDIEGNDGKDWNTQIAFNVIFEGENIGNFDGQTCCSGGRPGGSPNPTDWNPGDHIPRGIKTLPKYLLHRNNITREMLSNSYAFFSWRPVGHDECTGIRWTLTATFSDNSKAVYSRVETWTRGNYDPKQVKLKDNIK